MSDRHAFRAKWHIYSSGIFFVTICSNQKRHIFGDICAGEMHLSPLGKTIEACINDLPNHHKVEIHNSIVMPNHIHMVLQIVPPCPALETAIGSASAPATKKTNDPVGTRPAASAASIGCLKPPRHGEQCLYNHHNSQLSVIVGSLKSAVSRKYNRLMQTNHEGDHPVADAAGRVPTVWQQRFHEHIIRNQHAYDKIMAYVSENPVRWESDVFNR